MADTVGIVVVSHSRPLAEAAVRLATEMTQGAPVRIAVAAGLDDDTLGTDAAAIADAIGAVCGPAGAVVLMDLGSAVLSAEMARELLDADVGERVTLSPGPLVEGLVGAVVAAAGGADRAAVAAEAAAGLVPKESHLSAGVPVAAPAGGVRGVFVVTDPQGLHARPAAALVGVVRQVGVPVEFQNRTTGAGPVPAESLSRVATLGALAGHEVEVGVPVGEDAALARVLAAAAEIFPATPPHRSPSNEPLREPSAADFSSPRAGALPASPGTVLGPARRHRPTPASPAVPAGPAGTAGTAGPVGGAGTREPGDERRRLERALAAVAADVTATRDRVAAEIGADEAAIFDAHLLLLDDPDLRATASERIASGTGAADAWAAAVSTAEAAWRALPDPYLRARADDLAALRSQVLTALAPPPPTEPEPSAVAAGAVVIAAELTPAEAVGVRAAGVVLAHGSPTAHSVLLLRARGIPAVVAAGDPVLDVPDGTTVALDGATGELVVDPAPDVRDRFARARADATRRATTAARGAHHPARTTDGVHVEVGANVASLADATAAATAGADLAGLVRTEFLFLGRTAPPGVDEQADAYRALADALDGRRLTLRTLDAGGDKPLAYAPVPPSDNPFLGVRGLRFSLLRPDLFAAQLTAIVRVAHETPVTVLFPMVSTADELAAARRALDDAIRGEGRGTPAGLRVAAMVEVPAAALKAAVLAPLVDEFSIGTNDLTQYTLAAARGDGGVAVLGDPWDPGVLRLVDAVCRGAGERARVSVCGEFASEPGAAAALIGLGVRELSVAPGLVAGVKQAVREASAAAAARRAGDALGAVSAAAARQILGADRRAQPDKLSQTDASELSGPTQWNRRGGGGTLGA